MKAVGEKWQRTLVPLLSAVLLAGCHGGPHSRTLPSPKATTVEGVRLVSPAPVVERYCRIVAARSKFPVPCPTIAPEPRQWIVCRGTDGRLDGRGCSHRPGFDIEEIFHGPPGSRRVFGPITGPL